MPAHNEWMTLLIAACFFTSIAVGFTSWTTARARLHDNRAHPAAPWHKLAAAACALVLVAISCSAPKAASTDTSARSP